MAVYVVTWNLNREGANYDAKRRSLLNRIEKYDYVRDKDLESVVFISASSNAATVSANLREILDGNDTIFVSRLRAEEYNGRLSKTVWDWIRERR